jgi:hypothetical protein
MTTAEIITCVLTAALFFSGNQRLAARFLSTHAYISNMLSEGHFNRRLHRIPDHIWHAIFSSLSEYFKREHWDQEYIVDSFPVPVCDNIRIFRSKIYTEERYRGYNSSKKRYFFGIRVHLISTTQGAPVEIIFAPASENDGRVFKDFNLDLPVNSIIYADRAYTDYEYEEFLEENNICLVAHRKENATRQHDPCREYLRDVYRKRIETVFSQITKLFPKSIHAVTQKGFELKVYMFILAYSLQLFLQSQ